MGIHVTYIHAGIHPKINSYNGHTFECTYMHTYMQTYI
jgi:hypothetical protein